SPASGDGCSLLLRKQGPSRYYEISINRRDNTVSIRKRAGELFFLTAEIPHAAGYDRWQQIHALARDRQDGSVSIELYAEGALLASAVDDGTLGGPSIRLPRNIELAAENARIDVAAFSVNSLANPPQMPESRAPQLAVLTPSSVAAGGPALDLAL